MWKLNIQFQFGPEFVGDNLVNNLAINHRTRVVTAFVHLPLTKYPTSCAQLLKLEKLTHQEVGELFRVFTDLNTDKS